MWNIKQTLGKSCSFRLPRVPFVNCRQFMYLVISLLVLRAGYGIWLYQFLIIAYLFTLPQLLSWLKRYSCSVCVMVMMKQRWGLDRNVLRPTPGDPQDAEQHHWNTGRKENRQLNSCIATRSVGWGRVVVFLAYPNGISVNPTEARKCRTWGVRRLSCMTLVWWFWRHFDVLTSFLRQFSSNVSTSTYKRGKPRDAEQLPE